MYRTSHHLLRIVFLLLSLLLLNLSGCRSLSRNVKYDYAQNFEAMGSYNFNSIPASLVDDPDYQTLQQANISLAIENAMASKNIRKESRFIPDFWLNYYYTGDQAINSGELNRLFSYNLGLAWDDKYGMGEGKLDSTYSYGSKTLIIDLVSPDNRQLIWRGAASANIKPNDSQLEKQHKLQKSAQIILKPFPPKNNFKYLNRDVPD